MKRILAGLALLALVLWQVYAVHLWGPEKVQGRVYVATAAVSVLFMVLYARDPWYRNWFGRSLMLLAIAVFLLGFSVILYRFVGPDYPGRGALIVIVADLTLVAMVLRTVVLWIAQREDRRSSGRH